MVALIQLCVRLIVRVLSVSIVYVLTVSRRVYESIQYLNNIYDTMPDSKLNPVPSSISCRHAENNASQDVTTATLAIEDVKDTVSESFQAYENPEENNENIIKNEEEANTNKSFSQASENSNENQSKSDPNGSYILVNTNDKNTQEMNQNTNNIDEVIVTTLAIVLECCDMCVIL